MIMTTPEHTRQVLYNETVQRLAKTLYEFVYGANTYSDLTDEETIDNYFYDAQDLAERMPHLLPAAARDDL